MQLKLALLLAFALPLAFMQGVSAEDPELPIVGAVVIEGDGAWLGEFCMQTTGGVYLWDRPVCGMRSECQNGGLQIYILTENQCDEEECEGNIFIFLLSEGNCHECDYETIIVNGGVENCDPNRVLRSLI